MMIRETSDAGVPVVASAPDGPHAAAYIEIARNVWAALVEGAEARGQPLGSGWREYARRRVAVAICVRLSQRSPIDDQCHRW